jgi:hypothetical protein
MTIDPDATAVVVASLIALVLFILYSMATLRERGQNPHWSMEVYLYYNPATPNPDIAAVMTTYGAKVATIQQVEVYLVAGGGAHGYGYADGGAKAGRVVVGAVPTGLGGLTVAPWPDAAPPRPVGVWLYGAKPRQGARGVIPFSCAHWFQPI